MAPGSATRGAAAHAASAPSRDKQQRACANCARSKTRCVWPNATCCQRCSRAGLHCALPPASAPRKKRGKSTRVKSLEQKVESIMSILATNQQQPPPMPKAHQGGRMLVGSLTAPPTIMEAPSSQKEAPKTAVMPEEQYLEITPDFRVSLTEADQILTEYRSEMLPAFPFCPPPNLGAKQMLQEQPLLLKAIINACRPRPWPVKGTVDEWFRSYLAHHIVVLNEKKLEHLQVILILVAWNDWHYTITAHNTSLLQLAVGLVGDLGLNRKPEDQIIPARSIADEAQIQIRGFNMRREPTNAGRRAFLGSFYLSSTIGMLFRRVEPPTFTEYMDQCCRDLCEVEEYPTDLLAVALVRIQRSALRANNMFPGRTTGSQASLGIPYELAFATIHKELDAIIQAQPDKLMQNYLVWSHYHRTLLRLYEPVIFMEPLTSEIDSEVRVRALWACCQNAKSLMELYLSVPADILVVHSVSFVAHIGYGNLTLTRMLLLEHRDWDFATARKTVDYPTLTDRLSQHFEAVHRHWCSKRQVPEDEKGPFWRLAERVRWAKGWYLSKVSPGPSTSPTLWEEPLGVDGFEDAAWLTLLDGALVGGFLPTET